jgi:hypothetical protein
MERPTATLVRVSNIKAEDWGVTLTINCVPLPGMARLAPRQPDFCNLSAAWQILSASTEVWYAAYCPWQLYFVPEAVEKLIALASREAELEKQIDYLAARNCIHEDRVRRHALGKATN